MANIVVVFRKVSDAKEIRNVLMRSGFSVTAVCTTGISAVNQMDILGSGIVVCGYQLSDMFYTELRDNLPKSSEMLLMAREDALPSLRDNGIVCLSLPVKMKDLVDTVAMMERTLEARRKKKRSEAKARSQEENSVIARAKALLMDRNNMTEPEAHRYLQKCAMDTGTDLAETAQMVMDLYS